MTMTTSDDNDFFESLSAPENVDAKGVTKRPPALYLRAPFINSVEAELFEAAHRDLPVVIDFIESEDGPSASAPPRENTDELDEVRQKIAAYWSLRQALARSLGPTATRADYNAACAAEGITP
jgi:hypothetical protein